MKSIRNNPEHALTYHLRGAFRGYETMLARHLSDFDLPLSHFHILRIQWLDEGYSQKQISKKVFMTESVTSQVIKAMEKSGLIKRKLDSADSRKRRVFITPKGNELREKVVVAGIELAKAHEPDISRDHMKTTISVLVKIRAAFDAYNEKY